MRVFGVDMVLKNYIYGNANSTDAGGIGYYNGYNISNPFLLEIFSFLFLL